MGCVVGGNQSSRPGLAARVGRALLRLVVRFATGAPLLGQQRTNATFFRAGTDPVPDAAKPFYAPGRPSRWAFLAGWQRMAIRWGSLLLLWGTVVRPWPTMLLLAVGVALAIWWIARRRRSGSRQALVDSIVEELAQYLGVTEPSKATLDLPRDYDTNREALVRLTLPEDFPDNLEPTASGRALLDGALSTRLGDTWRGRWGWRNGRRFVEWRRVSPLLTSYESQQRITLDKTDPGFDH